MEKTDWYCLSLTRGRKGQGTEEMVLAVTREYIFQNFSIDPPQIESPISTCCPTIFLQAPILSALGYIANSCLEIFNMYAVERGLFTTYYSILLTSEYG